MTPEVHWDGADFDVFVGLAKRYAETPIDPLVDRIGRARLVEQVARAPGRRRILTSTVFAVPKTAWLAAIAFVVGSFVWGLASRPVEFVVRGTASSEPYVRVGDRPVDVDFSDGTRIHVATGARLRIEERGSRGARILVERGGATVSVAKRVRANWLFLAGPFEVSVQGAKFVMTWDPVVEQLDLEVHEGALEVDGPLGPRHVVVRAGQRLQMDLTKRSLLLFEPHAGPLSISRSADDARSDDPAADGRAVLEFTPSTAAATAVEPTPRPKSDARH